MSVNPDSYKIIRSNRKTLSIEVTRDLEVIVRAPKWVSLRDIRYFIDERENWIRKAKQKIEQKREENKDEEVDRLTREELQELADKAMKVIPERVAYYAPKIGVTYGRITIRNQKSRWGSCSSRGNLNFNCLLMLAPPEVVDAIVVHELCHRKEMNHSKKFYNEIYRVYPDYDKWDKWLKDNGEKIQRRNPNR